MTEKLLRKPGENIMVYFILESYYIDALLVFAVFFENIYYFVCSDLHGTLWAQVRNFFFIWNGIYTRRVTAVH